MMALLPCSMARGAMATAAFLMVSVRAHLYEIYPPSRQLGWGPDYGQSGGDCPSYGKGTPDCPAFMNAKGPETVKARAITITDPATLQEHGNGEWPLKWVPKASNGNYLEPDEIAKRHGICGDPNTDALENDNWYGTATDNWPVLETAQQAQVLEIKMGMHIYHQGHVEFFVCNTDELADPGGIPTQECFNQYPLSRAEDDGDASPIDPQYPGRYYVDPECRETGQSKPEGAMVDTYVITARYQLPPDLVCDHCILQMVYYTGNSCKHEGYDEFNPTSWPADCGLGKEAWIKTDVPFCGDPGGYPEEFWGCSDIKIVPYGTTPPPSATAKTCDGEIDHSDCPEGSNLYIGQSCNDCGVEECCGESGASCYDFDFGCPKPKTGYIPCPQGNKCTPTVCCNPTICGDATFSAADSCLSGRIAYDHLECTSCGPSECCDALAQTCEVLNMFDSGDSSAARILLPIDDCASQGAGGFQLTIPQSVISVARGEAYSTYLGCFDWQYLGSYGEYYDNLTPEVCFDVCNRAPFEYFRMYNDWNVEVHCECVAWHHNDGTPTTPADAEHCMEPCPGDASLTCGGTNHYLADSKGVDVYEIVNEAYTMDILDHNDISLTDYVGVPWTGEDDSDFVFTGVWPDWTYTMFVTGTDENNSGRKTCTDTLQFTAVCRCEDDSDCDVEGGELCCPTRQMCEVPASADACGDPHMTGFRGQKFDFIGEDGEWYCVLDDGPAFRLNMRVTSPVSSVPEMTYITGISVNIMDADDLSHTIVIQVTDPYNMASSCPQEVSPCLADGALTIEIDGHKVLLSPGTISVGPSVEVSAVNLPGACRSFGFEKYWERKKLEYDAVGRRLNVEGRVRDMGEWILGDPTITNIDECAEYVARATATGGRGLFAHESEHASFQITTPLGAVRLSHGRLHQLPMRDPTDQFDLPDHVTWQMNVAIDHNNLSPAATGILGETLVPTFDNNGIEVTQGMAVIRGSPEDYRVEGPLETNFAMRKESKQTSRST